MDDFLQALLHFKIDKFDECIIHCNKILEKNEFDLAAWSLKMQATTAKILIDDLENEESGIAESTLDDNIISTVTKPGTSLHPGTDSSQSCSYTKRPISQSGRLTSGFQRHNDNKINAFDFDKSMKASRTAHNSRPVSTASSRFIRIGTASMISSESETFILLSHINLQKYAKRKSLSKPLFEYIFYHENDVKHALELAALSTDYCSFQDWWWKLQLGKCYFRLSLYREAEQQLRSVLSHQQVLEAYIWLGRVFIKLDQPISAFEILDSGLGNFPNDVSLLIVKARIYESLNQLDKFKELCKNILEEDNMNVEAIACIANNYFYEDQAEIALKFYRRLFQMGVRNSELMNNLALCCLYSQQFDMCISCFNKALNLASKSNIADIYYNIGIVSLSIGDNNLAYQNFRLALSYDNEHAQSYNNLGILEMQKGSIDMARAFIQAAVASRSELFESHINLGLLSEKIGDLQSSYLSIKTALNTFSDHFDGRDIIKCLAELFSSV